MWKFWLHPHHCQWQLLSLHSDRVHPKLSRPIFRSYGTLVHMITFVLPIFRLYEACKVPLTENPIFSSLSNANYDIHVEEALGYTKQIPVVVGRNLSDVSFSNNIFPIITTHGNTTGCHDGTLGATLDFRTYPIVKSKASNIKASLVTMPPPTYPFSILLSQDQIKKIICWVDDGALNN